MQALIYIGNNTKNKVEWQEQPDLRVEGRLEAIVRPIASTTCDLDRRILRGETKYSELSGWAIGHECVAEVLEVGEDVRGVQRGDVVVVPVRISCGICARCRANLHSHCLLMPPEGASYGLPKGKDWGGLFSEQVRVPFADGMLEKVPDGIVSTDIASAGDNMTDAFIAVRRGMAKNPRARTLVVGGAESIGLFAADQALAQGAVCVDYIDADPARRAAAHSLGCDVLDAFPAGLDRAYQLVVFASRNFAEMPLAINSMSPGAHLHILTMFFGDQLMPLWEMWLRDVSMSIGCPNTKSNIPAVLEQVRCRQISPQKIVTIYDWTAVHEAFSSTDFKPVLVRPRIVDTPRVTF